MKKTFGLTLIELMTIIAVLGILVSVAIPTYLNHQVKTRRADGVTQLLQAAANLEKYAAHNNTYANAKIDELLPAEKNAKHWYTLSLANQSAHTYTIQAKPNGDQAQDTACGTFSLDQASNRKISGTGTVTECWGN